jgi:hydroxypyruvate isomerase
MLAALGVKGVHCLAGDVDPSATPQQQRGVYVANLRRLAARFAPEGITACLEPLNPRQRPNCGCNDVAPLLASSVSVLLSLHTSSVFCLQTT